MREQWQLLAAELGLEFRPGIDGFLDSPQIRALFARTVVGGDARKADEIFSNPMMRTLFGKVFTGIVTGNRDGFEVFLIPGASSSSSNRSHSNVQACLTFARPYELGLDIKAAGFFTRLGQWLSPTGVVRVPGEEFERRVSVRAKQAGQATALLSDGQLRDKILELYRFSPNFKIDDLGIRYQEPGRILSADRARAVLDLMTATARTFH